MRQYLLENTISSINKEIPLIIIKKIISFIYNPIIWNIKHTIIKAFSCYNCLAMCPNYFDYICSERCSLQIQGIYSDDEEDDYYRDNEFDEEQYIEDRRMDCIDDYKYYNYNY